MIPTLMENSYSKKYSVNLVHVTLLMGLCFILYFFNLGRWELWKPDEPRYAQVAREMVSGGDWILMHLNGRIYEDKPPLFFWAIAFSSFLWQGFTPFSVRFPSAVFGTLTVLLTFLMGKRLYDSRTGFLSGLILATSVEAAYLSIRANIDATLTFFTTASIFCFLCWYQGKKEERSTRIWGLSIYGFYVAMGLATLTKGPVGFLLPLFVSLIYLLIQKDWEGLKRMKLLPGMLLMIAIVLAWYLPAAWRGGQDYLNATLFKHTIDRYSSGWTHEKPIYFYLASFPVDFLPWSLFLPGAIAYGYARETVGKRKDFLVLLTWFLVIFLFFSFSKGKRNLYILPLYPAAALMVGKLWGDCVFKRMEQFRRAWISWPLFGFVGLVLLIGAAVIWVVPIRFPSYASILLPVAVLMVGGSAGLIFLSAFRRYGVVFFLFVGMITGGFFYAQHSIFPVDTQFKSIRSIFQEMKKEVGSGSLFRGK